MHEWQFKSDIVTGVSATFLCIKKSV